jgi:hypothetical protein
MSIFQIKEVWGTRVGNNEEFERNSICIQGSPTSENKIIVGKEYTLIIKVFIGSFEGYLRVYRPSNREYKP